MDCTPEAVVDGAGAGLDVVPAGTYYGEEAVGRAIALEGPPPKKSVHPWY